jgi:hypothetical protein
MMQIPVSIAIQTRNYLPRRAGCVLRSVSPTIGRGLLFLISLFLLETAVGRCQMAQFPLLPLDRKIDELGVEGRIQSEDDANSYVQALVDRLGFEKKGLPQLSEFKAHLAHAEYMSVANPSKRVPEALVAEAFNDLMGEWGAPSWTRINSVYELHAFRVVMSLIMNPKSVSRLPGGNVSTTCRPVEAVYLLWLLDYQMGIPPALREKLADPGWLASLPQNFAAKPPAMRQADALGSDDSKRRLEYLSSRSKYFAQYSIEEAATRIARILSTLDPQ